MARFTVILPSGSVLLKNVETGQVLRLAAEEGPLALGEMELTLVLNPTPLTPRTEPDPRVENAQPLVSALGGALASEPPTPKVALPPTLETPTAPQSLPSVKPHEVLSAPLTEADMAGEVDEPVVLTPPTSDAWFADETADTEADTDDLDAQERDDAKATGEGTQGTPEVSAERDARAASDAAVNDTPEAMSFAPDPFQEAYSQSSAGEVPRLAPVFQHDEVPAMERVSLTEELEALKRFLEKDAQFEAEAKAQQERLQSEVNSEWDEKTTIDDPDILRDDADTEAERQLEAQFAQSRAGFERLSGTSQAPATPPASSQDEEGPFTHAEYPEWDPRGLNEMGKARQSQPNTMANGKTSQRAYIPVLDAPFEALTAEDFDRALETMALKRNNIEGEMEYLEEIEADREEIDELADALDELDEIFAEVILRKEAFEKAGKQAREAQG
ncbi:MAG: hypothetical protein SOR95_02800 [Sutterella sp.]|nr:hypothetical protein [Sutterella sp.]